ncbi:polyprenyl synthetase family protein [Lacticaseibacillus nasuensis]|uniref:polyprenyl synthetase family protein n=1 Tax=Lacticaseibacillus nasuensis TaxID=944671 RepID=UPI002245DAB5|nr:farnesyl diphosphate synthase [Lacticaseibacillus nasuensis]MCX2455989.1 polyprenyl synthetase family protein [Lacticaseibacillus nasuensis]
MLKPATTARQAALEARLAAHFAQIENAHLREAMAYSVNAGGKRLRPLLLLATVASFDGDVTAALPAAAALELMHTYSLIHDDLPAMDNDDLRRGRPTNHKQFGTATAILAGDALQADALALVASTPVSPAQQVSLVTQLARAAGSNGMVAGQVMDMDGEHEQYDLATLRQLHRLKTGRLIQAAVSMGATIAQVPAATTAALAEFARQFGVAYQIADDIKDVTETAAELGKTPGKDVGEGKNTYVALLGLTGARQALADTLAAAQAALAPLGDLPELAAFLTIFQREEAL